MAVAAIKKRSSWVVALCSSALFTLLSCSGDTGTPNASGGTLVIVTSGDPGILFPPLIASTPARQITELVYDGLAQIGFGLNTIGDGGFRPQLAESWVWSRDSLSIAFHLNAKAMWHDGRPVHSDDVRFTFALYTDSLLGSSDRSELTNIDSVSTSDSLTAVFWFHRRSPFQFFDATSRMLILPSHVFGGIPADSVRKIAAAITPVGSGRFRFGNWKRGESFELISNRTSYQGPAKLGRVIWTKTPSPVTAATRLMAGEVDLYDTMRPENVASAARVPFLRVISSPGTDYVFMRFNLKHRTSQNSPHPIFASREVRRALSMAIDRRSMVQNVFDSLAVPGIGPTIRAYPTTDTTTIEELPYNPGRAAQLLDSLGWLQKTPGSTRERGGRMLHFTILVPASSLNRQKMGILLQEQFRKIGVGVDLDEVEYGTFQAREQARDFDAELGNWHLGASPASVKEAWTTAAAREKGGHNFGWYTNPVFDSYVDSATSTMDSTASRRYYTRVYSIANQDAPAIWLYEPRMVIGINKRIKTGPIRPDAWWSSLADWEIPTDEQIARDRIPDKQKN